MNSCRTRYSYHCVNLYLLWKLSIVYFVFSGSEICCQPAQATTCRNKLRHEPCLLLLLKSAVHTPWAHWPLFLFTLTAPLLFYPQRVGGNIYTSKMNEGNWKMWVCFCWYLCLFASHNDNWISEYHSCFLHTGKTVLLVLMGLRWLLQGNRVHIVSTDPSTLASSLMIQHQLEQTLAADPTAQTPGTVILHYYNFSTREADVAACVTDLLTSAGMGGHLHVLMDEVEFGHR